MTEEIITEKLYKIIWKASSANPGYIENLTFKESELPDHNRAEVLGPDREYVEAVPGSKLHFFTIDSSALTADHEFFNKVPSHWDWEVNDLIINDIPPLTWDDVRLMRNSMLSSCDNTFNIDTPDSIKQQWIDHRALLRDLPDRELAAGRTPDTVFWNDYLPPFPASARGGLTQEQAAQCVWYVAPPTTGKK